MKYRPTQHFRLWLGALLVPALVTLAPGCSKDPETTEKRCALDADCELGLYCGADGSCKSDCDETNACGAGQLCTERGKCLVSATECQLAEDCELTGDTRVCEDGTSVIQRGSNRCALIENSTERECRYEDIREPCNNGCNADTGECNPPPVDPCDGVTCDMPPANSCKDGDTLLSYGDTGSCGDGDCAYQPNEVNCPNGCEGSACAAVTCAIDTCDDAPLPEAVCSSENPELAVSFIGPPVCVEEDGSCDFTAQFELCTYTGATCTDGACVDPIAQSGEVIVTEYLVVPPGEEANKFSKQWIELYNTTDADVDLRGWTLATRTREHVFEPGDDGMAALIIPANSHIVIANGSDPLGDGTAPAYRYSDLLMGFEGSLTLKDGSGSVVDYLYWEPGSTTTGRARQIASGSELSAASNDSPDVWCPNLVDVAGTEGVYGTPGAANSTCSDDPCGMFSCSTSPADYCKDGATAVEFTVDSPDCQVSRFGSPYCDFVPQDVACVDDTPYCLDGACIGVPENLPGAAGELIITEVMGDPNGTDSDREWIEIYNTTDAELSLFTLKIEDNEEGGKFNSIEILDPAARVPAKGYAVLATNVDPLVNGGIQGAYLLGKGLLKNTPDVDATSGLSLMTLKIVTSDDTVIDEAYYATPESAEAQQLSLSAYTDAAITEFAPVNDTAANFCNATIEYAASVGSGSPGAPNEECP